MNIKRYTMVFLSLFLFVTSVMSADMTLNSIDFTQATVEELATPNFLIQTKLSPYGIVKVGALDQHMGQKIQVLSAGETHTLILSGPVDMVKNLELGPFTKEVAHKIAGEINQKKYGVEKK